MLLIIIFEYCYSGVFNAPAIVDNVDVAAAVVVIVDTSIASSCVL